ncbi:Lrp/AsnC family transcriptional regulator [Acetobacter senegalensis]|uniref:Lrp/AsnC family transcriptional regulator n=1 Tax=Acetobacter senegalensis TaxID=446692 RepID=UPI001D03A7AE|nr:Lrp/AsnC family transcriptional regulator [Acetobacter senegalensis]MCG4256363.1 Lrp/AsnC family transcriptional regulator [Acetobacter senegalensis]MCG4266079.1 Lrp/AsnC family transcriptional regulator [Acetobacter senegalensis]
MSEELDRIDRRLLRLLQKDGRMPNAEMAQRVNISAATCHRRVQRLIADGYIRNIRAQLEPAHLELATLVIVGVVLDRSTTDSFETFEQAVRDMPAVLDCYLVAGDFDYFLKIRVKDMADFNRFHASRLLALPGVRQTRTFFVMKEVVDGSPLDI